MALDEAELALILGKDYETEYLVLPRASRAILVAAMRARRIMDGVHSYVAPRGK